MKYGYVALLVSLLAGQIGGISIAPGVVVYLHDLVIAGLLAAWGWRLFRGRKIVKPKLLRPLVAFAAVGALSLGLNLLRFASWQVGTGSLYLLRWTAYACVYLMIVQDKRLSRFILWGLFAAGSAFSILGLAQYVLYPNLRNLWYLGWDPHYFRLFSTFLDPNFAGIFIVMTFMLGLLLFRMGAWRRVFVLEMINGVVLYLTYSRSSLVAFVLAVAAWIVLEKKWRALGALMLFAALVVWMPKPGGDTLRLFRTDSTVSRISNWQKAVRVVSASPLVGYGFNTLRFVPRGQPPHPDGLISKADAGVDNSVLFLLATTGVAGLAVYIWLGASMIPLFRVKSLPRLRSTGIAILVALGAHSMFLNSLFYPWVMIWVWMFAGASESLAAQVKKSRRHR